ncbi:MULTISPECIES: aromatic ring-opening dioxygenase LigA [unclassified Cryobacterium]|uniref:aromatic ring-opening dioxygenase LigA n=1 Tax=unclassified Cryobacterium TaxID=2649013 RepID=UPI0010694323|nr:MULTISPECIES: aromatic ring-opening dioxygenase LigA [unclassified Cryobacterium]TFC53554.1 aromatic ring-opening dioxygenase LigA [Cryobacterium sp. TMB3-1-2]TFC69220.1 aromatic ring-opening dioxygenase LigA [Cryobacterium sp. TMB3-15]TFC75982.1 aromatic ring-opening dioxygenase LigA [Cryobacterium sp. TMB3-10]TFD40472.1 aromatic ring-opening dioxygenase LigA [Cryobacterium sp. TMB3-12]
MSTATVPATTLGATKVKVLKLIGWAGILGAVVMIIGGGVVWGVVSSQLSAEKITVSEDAAFLAGTPVVGPFSAFAQADIINHHALDMAEGKTYAELDKEDPLRATVMNASFLRTSLFTSVVSFGVSAFAIGMGVLSGLFGWAILTLAPAWPKKTTATGVRA